MFKTEDIIGDLVFISFKDILRFQKIGILSETGHYLVKGFDHIGLWLEHPSVIIAQTVDKDGKPIPEKNIKRQKIDSIFLVTWDNIQTIMHYPNRDGFDFPSEFELDVGFKKS